MTLLDNPEMRRWSNHQRYTNALKYQLWQMLHDRQSTTRVTRVDVAVSKSMMLACGAPPEELDRWLKYSALPLTQRQVRIVLEDNGKELSDDTAVSVTMDEENTSEDWKRAATVRIVWVTQDGEVESVSTDSHLSRMVVLWRAPDGVARTLRLPWTY